MLRKGSEVSRPRRATHGEEVSVTHLLVGTSRRRLWSGVLRLRFTLWSVGFGRRLWSGTLHLRATPLHELTYFEEFLVAEVAVQRLHGHRGLSLLRPPDAAFRNLRV